MVCTNQAQKSAHTNPEPSPTSNFKFSYTTFCIKGTAWNVSIYIVFISNSFLWIKHVNLNMYTFYGYHHVYESINESTSITKAKHGQQLPARH